MNTKYACVHCSAKIIFLITMNWFINKYYCTTTQKDPQIKLGHYNIHILMLSVLSLCYSEKVVQYIGLICFIRTHM